MLRPWKITLGRIDPALRTPLYLQIVHAIIHEIERGRLPPGAFLPSSRELATILGVNRKTVVLAYEDLISQGWLLSEGTRGTVVAALSTEMRKPPPRPSMPSATTAPEYRFRAPPERSLALSPGKGVKLDEGAPDGRLFPADILSRAYRTAVQRASRDNRLQYRDPRGSPRLREAVATMLRGERGLAVTADDICITRGSQNGIYLAARTLLQPGDAVLVEALTYEPAVAAFTDLGANVVSVGLDENGADVEAIERACRKHRVRAIFLTPHHQFPTTVALRPERRLRVLELARQFGFAVIEDDYDHEFHFESQPLLPMASYAPGRVIYVGSLSKLLLPALRVGYIARPQRVHRGGGARRLVDRRHGQHADRGRRGGPDRRRRTPPPCPPCDAGLCEAAHRVRPSARSDVRWRDRLPRSRWRPRLLAAVRRSRVARPDRGRSACARPEPRHVGVVRDH
jgi:GntR family transcriptional regulator/MocR family aminotransferase